LKNIITILLAFVLVVTVILLPSCSENSVDEDNRFMELLSLLPATAVEDVFFALVDYDLFRKANSISLYNTDNNIISSDEFFDIFEDKIEKHSLIDDDIIFLGSYYTGWSEAIFYSTIKKKYLGYDITSVNAEINNVRPSGFLGFEPDNKHNSLPPLRVAAIGKYDPEKTMTALNNQDEWPSWAVENYNSEIYKDLYIFNWGDGDETHSQDTISPPHLDQLGRARPFSVSDTKLFVSNSVQNVKSIIDSSLGEIPSLADVPEYALLARGLYTLESRKAAILGDEAVANGQWWNRDVYLEPRLKKFQTFGTGYGQDEKGYYIALVLVHENSDMAEQNAILLEERITTTFSVEYNQPWIYLIYDSEFNTEGRVLLAKLYTYNKKLWLYWFITQSDLLWHEQ